MQRTLKTSGAETTSAAGNIFVGQTEAPLLIRPFVDRMTLSELTTVMTGGFATVAGGALAAYVALLVGVFPDIAGHLLAASIMAAPAGIVMSKMLMPETEEPVIYTVSYRSSDADRSGRLRRVEIRVDWQNADASRGHYALETLRAGIKRRRLKRRGYSAYFFKRYRRIGRIAYTTV